MQKPTTVLFAGFISISALFSQETLTPAAAIAAALSHNYGILLAKNDSAAAALDVGYIYGGFLPRLNATIGTVWNNNDQRQEFSDGAVREQGGVKSNNLTGSLNLNWTLFDGMKMFVTKEKTLETARLGEVAIKNEVVNTVAEVTRIYFNIVQQKQQLKAIAEQMSVSEERVKVAERKLSTGLGSKPELLQAKVDLNAQKARQLQQLTLIAQLKEQLNQLAGMRLPETFDVVEDIPFNPDLSLAEIQGNIGSTNPSLLLAQRNIGIAQLTLRERKAERFPTVSFNSAYNFNRLDNQSVVNPLQTLISRSNGLNVGLTANVPILNNRLVQRNIEQAQIDIDYLQLSFASQRTVIDADLRNAYRDYGYQKQALLLEGENIELAKENVAIALERFRQGISTYLELREAQKSLEDAYNRLIAARYNAKVAETELLRLKGDLVR
ncbi:MAG: TolC family protein [Bacteroidetes bacterium]|nr:TolC family protein [Bacteroidota bacterium]